jgi:hypothetical protein
MGHPGDAWDGCATMRENEAMDNGKFRAGPITLDKLNR